MDFAKVLGELAAFLGREGARFALAGAFALRAHGLSRLTGDLDLVVDAAARPALLRFLTSLGYQQLHVSAGYSNHLHPDPARGRVDLIYVEGTTADALFGGAVPTSIFPGVEATVPRAEHVAAMKVHAMKNDPSRTFKELADLQYLLGLPGIDEAEVRGYFDRHGLLGRFDELQRLRAADRNPGDAG